MSSSASSTHIVGIREVRGLPLDDALRALGRPGGRGENEQRRPVRVDAGGEHGCADRDREADDALPRSDCPERPAALDRLGDDDDHEKADARDEPGMQVRPEQEQRGQQPEPPCRRSADTNSAIQSVQQTSANVKTCGRVPSTGSADARAERESDGEDHWPGAAKPAAQQRREQALHATSAHQHGHEEEPADRGESGEDRLRQPLVRDQRIAERGVGEQLAGGDLVVGDDPVAEADVPPDIGIAQRIEPDARR